MAFDRPLLVLFSVGLVGGFACYFDFRYRELPDLLSYLGGLLGLIYGFVFHGWTGAGMALGGAACGVAIFWFLWSLGMLGSGDVFLMGAFGALLAWPLVVWAIAYAAIVGAVVGLIYALARGTFLRVFRNLWTVIVAALHPKKKRVRLEQLETEELPYGVAISIGALWAALLPYLPEISLI